MLHSFKPVYIDALRQYYLWKIYSETVYRFFRQKDFNKVRGDSNAYIVKDYNIIKHKICKAAYTKFYVYTF